MGEGDGACIHLVIRVHKELSIHQISTHTPFIYDQDFPEVPEKSMLQLSTKTTTEETEHMKPSLCVTLKLHHFLYYIS